MKYTKNYIETGFFRIPRETLINQIKYLEEMLPHKYRLLDITKGNMQKPTCNIEFCQSAMAALQDEIDEMLSKIEEYKQDLAKMDAAPF